MRKNQDLTPLVLTPLVLLLFAVSLLSGQDEPATIRPALSEARGLADWNLDGNGQWTVRDDVLVLHGAGEPGGPIRRPAALAILKSEPFTAVTMSVDVRSTAPADLLVRDVLLIAGYQSPTRFYYVHLSARTDAVHNGLFLVDNADRRRIDQPAARAPLTDQHWHRVRLERDPASGRIAVFFGDEPSPLLSATDRTLTWGRVGVGSFDETAEFRNVEVRGSRLAATSPNPK